MGGLTSRRACGASSRRPRERFDWVIVDTPPVGPLADASLLGAMVDGALLVVRAGQTPYATCTKAIEALGRERILGVVLNGARRGRSTLRRLLRDQPVTRHRRAGRRRSSLIAPCGPPRRSRGALSLVVVEHLLIVAGVARRRPASGCGATVLTDARLGRPVAGQPDRRRAADRLHYCDLYDLRTLRDRRDLVIGLLQALGAASLMLALLYYWLPELDHRPRRVRDRRGAHHRAGRRLADRLRVAVAAASARPSGC